MDIEYVCRMCELHDVPHGVIDTSGDPAEVFIYICELAMTWSMCTEASASTDTAQRLVMWARRVTQKINLPGPVFSDYVEASYECAPYNIITPEIVRSSVAAPTSLNDTAELTSWPF